MKRVHDVTGENFSREVFFSPIPVVVDVYASWCGPCRAVTPLLENLADLYAGKVKFLKVNIDDQPDIAEIYGVQAVPTLLFFNNGELVDRIAGIPPLQTMLANLDALTVRPIRRLGL